MPPRGQVLLGAPTAVAHPQQASAAAGGPERIAGNLQGARTDLELRTILNDNRDKTVPPVWRLDTGQRHCRVLSLPFSLGKQ